MAFPIRHIVCACVLQCALVRATEGIAAEPMTFCEVTSHPQQHAGAMVRMKAASAAGLHGGTVLFDDRCPITMIGKSRWPNSILLVPASLSPNDAAGEVFGWATEFFLRRTVRGTMPEMEFVVVGTLETVDSSKEVEMVNGLARGPGFGRDGALPFKLVIKHIESVLFREKAAEKISSEDSRDYGTPTAMRALRH